MVERWIEIDIDFVFSVLSIVCECGVEVLFVMVKECNFEIVWGRYRVVVIILMEFEVVGFFLLNKYEV